MPGYRSVITQTQGDGTALTASTTETSLIPLANKLLIPPVGPFALDRIGKVWMVTASGRISNIVTTPGTLILKFKLGPTANIAVATSQAFPLNIVAKTNVAWWLRLKLTLRATGSGTSANFMHSGTIESESLLGAAAGVAGTETWQASAPVVGTGFDASVANQIDLTGTWSLNNANSIQVHDFLLEDLTTAP